MKPASAATRDPLPATRLATLVGSIYWATPLFAALDFLYGVSLRVPFLDALPGAKAAYYAMDLACGVAIVMRPRLTAAIGLGESVVNIALLVLSTGAAYLAMLDSAASPDVVMVNPFTPQAVASLAISPTVLAASYTINSSALRGYARSGWAGPPSP